jgi:hypothetical protein
MGNGIVANTARVADTVRMKVMTWVATTLAAPKLAV